MIFERLKGERSVVYILMCLGCFVISFNVAAISAAVPEISRDLRYSDFEVARIIPYYLMPYGIGALLYAPLTRFFSFRRILCLVMAFYGLACYVCSVATDLNVLLAGRVAMGISGAGVIPMGLMLIGEHFDKSIRGRLVGVFFSHAFIASIAGLVVGAYADWPMIFRVPAAASGILLVMFGFYRSDILGSRHSGRINYLAVLGNVRIRRVFMYIFAISFLYHGVHKWYGVFLSRVYGFDKVAINVMIVLTVIGGMLGQLTGGYLTDKKGRRFTVQAGVIGLSIGIALLYLNQPVYILGIVLTAISIFWTVGHNGISTVLTDFSDADRPAVASLNSAVRFISGGLGFAVSTRFVEHSFQLTFLCVGCLTILLYFTLRAVVPQEHS